jgi:hypothetical protein
MVPPDLFKEQMSSAFGIDGGSATPASRKTWMQLLIFWRISGYDSYLALHVNVAHT